jgi:predicted DNA-binding transcriptional regulator YafY
VDIPEHEDGMAKKRSTPPMPAAGAVTPERAARLYRLLRILAAGPRKREALIRRLRLDVRGFYRDLELLRAAGIDVPLQDRRYSLEEDADAAVARLPFPDPHFTLGEMQLLAKGRSKAHRKLRDQIKQIVG